MASSQGWDPLQGEKRKACVACMDDNFEGFGPAPPKLSAVDEDVVDQVLGDYKYVHPTNLPPPQQTKVVPMEEDVGGSPCINSNSSMAAVPFQKQPGNPKPNVKTVKRRLPASQTVPFTPVFFKQRNDACRMDTETNN